MATGEIHNRHTLLTAVIVAPLLGLVTGNLLAFIFALFFGLSQIFLSPDLDQQTFNRVENILLKHKIKPIQWLGRLYVSFWMPYALTFPHRSFWTHFPVIGTLLRMIYIVSGIYAIHTISSFFIEIFLESYKMFLTDPWPLACGLLSICLADVVHYIADQFYTPKQKTRTNNPTRNKRR